MARENPDVVSGTSNKYANWEVVDPEKWVPDGYVCIRVDSRGAGRSPGYLRHNDARETRDIHLCIEWAASQPWCTGKVGMNGISYYASNQWRAAASQPPHLAAICVWEGWADAYRDSNRHGGIACTFRKNWQDMQVKTVQHGVGERGRRHPVTGELACGPETLTEEELVKNREDMWAEVLAAPARFALLPRADARPVQGDRSAPLLRQLGRPGAPSAGQFRGLPGRGISAEVARGARRLALGALLHRLRRQAAEALLRPLPQGRGQRLGEAAPGPAPGAPSGRAVRPALRKRMAARRARAGHTSTSTRRACGLRPRPSPPTGRWRTR